MHDHAFAQEGRFYRGNLHTHSTNSDGVLPPGEVIARYRAAGYDFLALTDHFMARYDFPVTDTRAFRDEDFTTLIAAELHAPRTRAGELWHIKAIGLPLDFAPLGENESGPEIARRAAEAGAFIGIVHPSWYGLTVEDAREIEVAHAVEIYNHGSAVEVDRGNDWPFCDLLLNEGWRLGGYASDDAHHLEHDAFGGWVHVKAPSLCPDALLAALKAGHYYSSQGPEIVDLRIDDAQVHVECSAASVIAITGHGARSAHLRGEGMTSASLPLTRFPDGYFRLTVTDAHGRRAWTNPLWRDV